jgi:hypothetical protein
MNDNFCCCGAQAGYPHRADCPRPLYNASDAQFEAWEKDWLALVQAINLPPETPPPHVLARLLAKVATLRKDCPKCNQPGKFVRHRYFEKSTTEVWTCVNRDCQWFDLYWYPEQQEAPHA